MSPRSADARVLRSSSADGETKSRFLCRWRSVAMAAVVWKRPKIRRQAQADGSDWRARPLLQPALFGVRCWPHGKSVPGHRDVPLPPVLRLRSLPARPRCPIGPTDAGSDGARDTLFRDVECGDRSCYDPRAMNCSRLRMFPAFPPLLLLVLALTAATAYAQTVGSFAHAKIQNYRQSSPATPILDSTQPFQFGSFVMRGTATIESALLTFPGAASPRPYTRRRAGALSQSSIRLPRRRSSMPPTAMGPIT